MIATPKMTLRHLFFLGIISIFCFLVIFEEKSLTGLLISVDNVPKRQASLGIQSDRQASLDIRSNRFPSVEDRVKLYMSNWYVPPCPGNFIRVNRLKTTSVAIQERTTTTQASKNETGRTLVFKSDVQMDRIFFLDRHKLLDCTKNAPHPAARDYCQDVRSTLVPALDRVGDNGTTPVLIQFGDNIESFGHGSVNLPHIKKIRSVATKASLSNVTLDHCYIGPRDPLHTKHDKDHLQPILWKLNNKRHYGMIPDVKGNDISWSLKKNMAVFRGALTGVTREQASRNSNFDTCMHSRRCRLVFRHDKSTLVDAKITRTIGLVNDTIKGVKVTGPILNMTQQLQYKALIMVEGNDVATGLKWALLSNSVVMMQPPSHTSWAMEELLEPWVHYIPLNDELSDVEEKMQWVLDNDKQAQLIAQRGTLWIHDLVLHPDASNDDKRIQEEIIRRYRAHFVPKDESANIGSTQSQTLASSPLAASKDLMVLAFYYPWYIRDDRSRHGTQGSTPLQGHYDSNKTEVAERHIDMAVRGGIDAWVVSWWTQDSPVTDDFVKGMLSAKNIDKIKFCMIYESTGALPVNGNFANGTLALDKFISDMIFFRDSYFGHPSYLHINGRPVVYVTRFWKNFEPFMLEKIKTAVGKDILIIADAPATALLPNDHLSFISTLNLTRFMATSTFHLKNETLRPCRVAITNSVSFHQETLESIASQLPTKYLHFSRATQTCDVNSLVFDYHVFAGGVRVQSWTYYFHLAMQGRDVTHLKAKNDPTKKRAIGNLHLYSKLPANRILSLDGYDAYVEATCYCRPGDVTSYGSHPEWLSQNDRRTCIFHVRCPPGTLKNHTRTVWVSPHYPEYYIPSVLPGFREKPREIRHENPELCVIGAAERRDFNLLAHYYQNHTTDRFRIHIYGLGNYPDSMKPYQKVVEKSELTDYQAFHDHVGRCDAILALLTKKNNPSYFAQKLTGIIPILLAYKQPAIIHEDLYELYKEQLPGNVSYETHSDEASSFVDALDRFLDKISE